MKRINLKHMVMGGCAMMVSAGVVLAQDSVSKSAGTVWDDPDSFWVQNIKILGRFQYQYAHIEGTGSDGRDFSYDSDEFRRVWLGMRADLLKSMRIQGQWDIVDDGHPKGDSRTFDSQIWELFGTVDLGHQLQFDDDTLVAGYGRRILQMGGEWHTSSTKIKTVERSAIANKIWPDDTEASNPNGFWLAGGGRSLKFNAGVFSTETSEGLAGWESGAIYYADVVAELPNSHTEIIVDGFYQDVSSGDEVLADGLEWASSLSLAYNPDLWYLLLNAVYGNNGSQDDPEREDDFWGVVILPSCYIWKDRLEGVMRYEYMGAENPRGASINSRYAGRAAKKDDIVLDEGGRGDRQQSIYLGINYYIYGHRMKVMSGIEYEEMKSRSDSVYDGWTVYAAFRTYL
jgi:phosphate-selective porin OprO/OprP